jgi:hypothetical protein
MTLFIKSKFSYHGGFLTYTGTYDGQPVYKEPCHPSRLGKPIDAFIARFKYAGPITKAKFVAELVKNHTVEDYTNAYLFGNTPVGILKDANPEWYERAMKK